MATINKNLSEHQNIPNAGTFRFGIVVSEWNIEITGALLEGAVKVLKDAGCTDHLITTIFVPGSFELPYGAQKLLLGDGFEEVDAVICLGCVIQGETPHFDFVCQSTALGIMQAGLEHNKPAVFGVLTTLDLKQAQERAGGKHGNKGTEAAVTALKMLNLKAASH